MLYSKIKSIISERGISTRSLEKETGIGENTIWRWDKHSPSIDKVKAVADYLGVTIDELVSG